MLTYDINGANNVKACLSTWLMDSLETIRQGKELTGAFRLTSGEIYSVEVQYNDSHNEAPKLKIERLPEKTDKKRKFFKSIQEIFTHRFQNDGLTNAQRFTIETNSVLQNILLTDNKEERQAQCTQLPQPSDGVPAEKGADGTQSDAVRRNTFSDAIVIEESTEPDKRKFSDAIII
ncbi:hypothetical protein FNU76_18320 [Chitinimonas arctica]|uniref:Uncharacterized protein n=1 Tax=Chitinimonas arctica TaxID=2594795 RepID=A0A516SJ21_9NEIS|nr:hypothetical protein [Chitinimonas arctica]QDQ28144.1 hypothetical protein FNU76_18320 [Chitinimonas arctica]